MVAKIIPSVQAAALVAHNVGKVKKKKLRTKDILNLGVTNIVGTGLIKETATITSSL